MLGWSRRAPHPPRHLCPPGGTLCWCHQVTPHFTTKCISLCRDCQLCGGTHHFACCAETKVPSWSKCDITFMLLNMCIVLHRPPRTFRGIRSAPSLAGPRLVVVHSQTSSRPFSARFPSLSLRRFWICSRESGRRETDNHEAIRASIDFPSARTAGMMIYVFMYSGV